MVGGAQRVALVGVFLCGLTVSGTAQPLRGWRAGVAKNVITPAEPIWLSGYEERSKPHEGVLRDLYVKALALEDETGKSSVLVTADILGYSREAGAAVAEQCRQRFGLSRDRLILNASHTHSAPVIDPPTWPEHELMPEAQIPVVKRYTASLIEKTVETVGAALKNMAPARLRFAQGFAAIGVNRRRAVMGRSLPGQVDQDVPVLAVNLADGALLAVVAGYACHATVLNTYPINGDWPGFAQEEIERQHPGTIAMYVQGCAADINPLPRRSVSLARTYGRILDAAVEEVLSGEMSTLSGPLRTAYGMVDLPFHDVPSRVRLEKDLHSREDYQRVRARRMLAILDRGEPLPAHYAYPVQVWRIGPKWTFIALGGEVVSDYSLRLKQLHGFDNTWVAAYSNDVFGYVGSRRVLQEGGYEGGNANTNFPGPFSPAVEELIIEKTGDLMRQLMDAGDRK
jgi:neutral ceramidase